MTSAANQLYQDAMKLREDERAELAALLIESIDPASDTDWAQAWDAEIAQRVAEVDQGTVKAIPWEEVRQRMTGTARQ